MSSSNEALQVRGRLANVQSATKNLSAREVLMLYREMLRELAKTTPDEQWEAALSHALREVF